MSNVGLARERVNKQHATERRQYGVIYLSLKKVTGGEELPELQELPENESLRQRTREEKAYPKRVRRQLPENS